MTRRMILGGLLAGLLMFIWSSLAHTVLPIGEMGISTTANEDAILTALKTNLTAPGFYFIPGHQMMQAEKVSGADRQKAMEDWQNKYGGGPWAVMMYHPSGASAMATRQLVCELVSDLIAGIILAFALLMSAPRISTFLGRVGFVTLLGLLPFLIVEVSYLNWYGFPLKYGIGQLLDQGIGAVLAGLCLAALFRKV